jgi:hypothetical protein
MLFYINDSGVLKQPIICGTLAKKKSFDIKAMTSKLTIDTGNQDNDCPFNINNPIVLPEHILKKQLIHYKISSTLTVLTGFKSIARK